MSDTATTKSRACKECGAAMLRTPSGWVCPDNLICGARVVLGSHADELDIIATSDSDAAKAKAKCGTCGGYGDVDCTACDGAGSTECSHCGSDVICGDCEGEGWVECPDCKGEIK